MNNYIDNNRERVAAFITKVFNFYNGRINIFNPAKLYIDFGSHMNSDNGGTSRNPNIVTVFPKVIERHMDNTYDLYYNFIVTVIHELYHCDQNINYIRLSHDLEYKKFIEYPVEMNTYLYIANHQREILENFGVQDVVKYSDYYPTIEPIFENGQLYQRRTYLTHMISILRDITYAESNPVIVTFTEAFNDMNSVIEIHLNDLRFCLKDGIYCMPVAQLNEILEKEFFQYNLRSAYTEINKYPPNNYIITISTFCKNFMGKIITH